MKTLVFAAGMAIVVTGGGAHAAAPEHDMAQHQMAAQPATSHVRHRGTGSIKEVNAKAGKVLIRHEPIASLQWPGMTMWFELQAPLPEDVRVGDRVRFELEQTGAKSWVITRIERER